MCYKEKNVWETLRVVISFHSSVERTILAFFKVFKDVIELGGLRTRCQVDDKDNYGIKK